jgi:hypothetical protein
VWRRRRHIWYRLVIPYSPPGSTTITVDAAGSDFDTAVAVYTPDYSSPSPPGGLTLLGCNATGLRSWQTFTAEPGVTYYVQVGGRSGATGNLVVHAGVDADADGLRDDVEHRADCAERFARTRRTTPTVTPAVTMTGPAPLPNLNKGLTASPAALFMANRRHLPDDVGAADAQAVFGYSRRPPRPAPRRSGLNANGIKDAQHDRTFVGPARAPAHAIVSAAEAQLALPSLRRHTMLR